MPFLLPALLALSSDAVVIYLHRLHGPWNSNSNSHNNSNMDSEEDPTQGMLVLSNFFRSFRDFGKKTLLMMYLLIRSFFRSFIHFSILFLGGIHDAVGRYTNLFATDSITVSLLHRYCHQTSMVLSNTLRGHTGYSTGTYADALAHESSQPRISFAVWHLWK